TLPQEVPALVELDLELVEALLLLGCVRAAPGVEVVFLADEASDALDQVMVIHEDSSSGCVLSTEAPVYLLPAAARPGWDVEGASPSSVAIPRGRARRLG